MFKSCTKQYADIKMPGQPTYVILIWLFNMFGLKCHMEIHDYMYWTIIKIYYSL